MRVSPPRQFVGRSLQKYFLPLLLFSLSTYSLGINCRGSLYCLGQDKNNVTGSFLDLTSNISTNAIYGLSVHIACMGAIDQLRGHTGAFCLFMQGKNPHGIFNHLTDQWLIGIDGTLIKKKLNELYAHGCRACGSVPIANNNNPDAEGILTLNYVDSNDGCSGNSICNPTIAADDPAHNPLSIAQDLFDRPAVVNQTADGTQECAQPGGPIVTDGRGVPLDDCDPNWGPSPNAFSEAPLNGTVHAAGARKTPLSVKHSNRMANLTTPTIAAFPPSAPTTIVTQVSSSSESGDVVLWGGFPKRS